MGVANSEMILIYSAYLKNMQFQTLCTLITVKIFLK